jgi:hypothetical protein
MARARQTVVQGVPANMEMDGQDFEAISDEIVEDQELSHGLPLIKGARVVYIGAKKNMSLPMKGRILDEPIYSETEVEADADGNAVLDENGREKPLQVDTLKTCIPDGFQSYDFSTVDSKGRPIKQHRLPADAPTEIAGRRYSVVEHPDHLMAFQRRTDANGTREFRVLVPKSKRQVYQDYVSQMDHAAGRNTLLLKRTTEE